MASEPPRRMHALPDLMHSAEASAVTFGRDSYTVPTTPSGTRMRPTWIPDGRYLRSAISPIGSGRATICRRPSAIASMPDCGSVRRSTNAASSPAARDASTSRALAARSRLPSRSSATAALSRAAFLLAVEARASTRDAAHAAPRRVARASASSTVNAILAIELSASSRDSQFPVDPRAAHGAPRRVARPSASSTINAILAIELSASSVDSQFPVDPRAAHGAPRRVARAATRNSRPIPLHGCLATAGRTRRGSEFMRVERANTLVGADQNHVGAAVGEQTVGDHADDIVDFHFQLSRIEYA